jgi:hypothetical protein
MSKQNKHTFYNFQFKHTAVTAPRKTVPLHMFPRVKLSRKLFEQIK